MDKLIVDENFESLFPQAQVLSLEISGINNNVDEAKDPYFQKLLDEGTIAARRFLDAEVFSQNDVVAQWRKAFQQFKTKKGARSSIEALLKRVDQDKRFSPINPLVDIYNSVSLKYGVPCGGEDTDKIVGDLHLGIAKGGEQFLPLGADEDAPALPEEVIYYDKDGAICRCFNWREAQRTMLTEKTTNAILIIESINEEQNQRAEEAMAELQALIRNYFGVNGIVNKYAK